jgi:hypothetical protein
MDHPCSDGGADRKTLCGLLCEDRAPSRVGNLAPQARMVQVWGVSGMGYYAQTCPGCGGLLKWDEWLLDVWLPVEAEKISDPPLLRWSHG